MKAPQKYRTKIYRKRHTMSKQLKAAWDRNKEKLSESQRTLIDRFYWRQKATIQIARELGCTNGNVTQMRQRAEQVLKDGVPSKLYCRQDYPVKISVEETQKRTAITQELVSEILTKRFVEHHSTVEIAHELNVRQMDVSVICNVARHAEQHA